MKLFRISFSLLLIPLLIFSSGGFNVFTHLCHESGRKIVSWQGPQSCEHDHSEEHSDEHSCGSCCDISIDSGHCCENIHEFIKTIETISIGDNEDFFVAEPLVVDVVEKLPVLFAKNVSPIYNCFDFSSPPRHTSKFLVVKYGNLKLDCCNS